MSHAALLIPTLNRIAGAERQVILLAKGLRRRGWQVSVVTLSGSGGAAARELTDAGIEFLSLGMRKGLADPRGWVLFNWWLRREKPDVVHTHLPHAAWFARLSRLWAPIPVLIDTLHSSSTGTSGRRLAYRLSRSLSDQVTAVSRAVADSHLAAGMATAGNLTVLQNGVDTEEWRPDAQVREAMRRRLRLGDQFLWLAVGRLDPVKDYPTLLKAMAQLPHPSRLVIAGTGPILGNLAHLSSYLRLGGRVRFLGFEPNLKPWLQAADGFVLASRWEGLPMALLEAASCALPAVATDVPGTREVILDNRTGLLVPASDPAALAAAMNALMQAPLAHRHAMGAEARQRAINFFSLDSALDRWEKLYSDLLRGEPRESAPQPATAPWN